MPLDWETLEAIAHTRGHDILVANQYVQRAADDVGTDPNESMMILKPYADRSGWDGYYVEAEQHLDVVDFGDEPFPWVTGEDWFDDIASSAAWKLVGCGAIAGYARGERYGVVVRSQVKRAPYSEHVLVVDPRMRIIHEGARRKADGQVVVRTYKGATEELVRKAGQMGPNAIDDDCTRSPFRKVEPMDDADPITELLAQSAVR